MKEENIIVLSYDDVADSYENPFKGSLYNKPGDDAVDVNKGCVKDYTKGDVTPDNFLNVLKGDADAMKGVGTGKVLKSTKDDKVFINFVDHGGAGLIGFPSSYLYADDLNDALKYMHDNNMYGQLTFYLEACESGSMFEGILPADINIYATTAANSSESSWGTYCPPDDTVKGTSLDTCLGDLYSINWMEDSDANDITKESLATQYQTVKTKTNKSHVMEFGTTTFTTEPVADFQGTTDVGPAENFGDLVDRFLAEYPEWAIVVEKPTRHVDSRDIKLMYLLNKLMKNPSNTLLQEKVTEEMSHRKKMDSIFGVLDNLNATDAKGTDFQCYKEATQVFRNKCFNGGMLSEYALKYQRVLYNACADSLDLKELESYLDAAC